MECGALWGSGRTISVGPIHGGADPVYTDGLTRGGDTVRARYEIYVVGRLGPVMQHALADLRPEVEGPNTRLSTDAVDQAELYGILGRVRGLALEVHSVQRTDSEAIG